MNDYESRLNYVGSRLWGADSTPKAMVWDCYRQQWEKHYCYDDIRDEVLAALPEAERDRIRAHLPSTPTCELCGQEYDVCQC